MRSLAAPGALATLVAYADRPVARGHVYSPQPVPRAIDAALLHWCSPGSGRQPLYAAAVRVLHEEGGNLSPLQVLAALPDSMPLHVAVEQLNSMLAGVMHRRRHTQVCKLSIQHSAPSSW